MTIRDYASPGKASTTSSPCTVISSRGLKVSLRGTDIPAAECAQGHTTAAPPCSTPAQTHILLSPAMRRHQCIQDQVQAECRYYCCNRCYALQTHSWHHVAAPAGTGSCCFNCTTRGFEHSVQWSKPDALQRYQCSAWHQLWRHMLGLAMLSTTPACMQPRTAGGAIARLLCDSAHGIQGISSATDSALHV